MIQYKLGEMFLLDPTGIYCRDPQLETVFILKLINIVDEDGNSIFDKGNNIVSAIAYEDGGNFEGVFLNTITQETVVIKKELLFRPGALVNIEEYLKVIDVTKKIYVNRVENFDITDKVIEALDLVLTSSIRDLVKARTRNEQLYNAICEMETHINELRRLKLCRYTNKALINITEKDKKIFTDLNMMNEFYKLTDMIKEVRKGEDTLVYCRDDVLRIYGEVEDAPPDGTEYASFVYTDLQNLIIKYPSLKKQIYPLNYPLNPLRIKRMGIRATENEKWLKSYY